MNESFRPAREPVLNLPPAVTASLAVFIVIHVAMTMILSDDAYSEVMLLFAFFPLRYSPELLPPGEVFPGGLAADVWTFVSYAFLHGSWAHLLINGLWLVIFGSAVERRFGVVRFVAFALVCAAAGAGLHLATHVGDGAPVIGASAAISGLMAGCARFVFETGGPLGALRMRGGFAYAQPAMSLVQVFSSVPALAILGLAMASNVLTGLLSMPMTGAESDIAWQAHIGGLVAGLLLFPLFDPVPRRRP